MKVPFLKFGKAKKRLNEVKRLREEANAALEQSPYKDNYSFVEHVHDEVVKEKTTDVEENDQYIHTGGETYTDAVGVSTAGRVAATITGVLTWMVLFPLEVVTYPLRAMAYGVEILKCIRKRLLGKGHIVVIGHDVRDNDTTVKGLCGLAFKVPAMAVHLKA